MSDLSATPTLEPVAPEIVMAYTDPPADDQPPGYEAARIPLKPVTYQFSTLPSGACILLPSWDAADTRPLYHIRTFQSVFSPLARKTVVRRGGGDDGAIVGEFEFGLSTNKPYISIHGETRDLTEVLYKLGKGPGHISGEVVRGQWIWSLPPLRLHWSCMNRTTWICNLPENAGVLARYKPPELTKRNGQTMPKLQVTPEGQLYFDEILISAIILEQKATLSMPGYKSHFNF